MPEAGEFWVLQTNGAPVVVPGIGRIDRNGRLIEMDGKTRRFFESRSTPVEVITDKDRIASLKGAAEKRAAKAAVVTDKRKELLAEIEAG